MRTLCLTLPLILLGCAPQEGEAPQAPSSKEARSAAPAPIDTGGTACTSTSAFSCIGEAAIAALEANHAADRGHTWQSSTDATFSGDWLLQVPAREYWGSSIEDIEADPGPGTGVEHPDFGLPYCDAANPCTAGTCRAVSATVDDFRSTSPPDMLCMGPSDHVWDAMYEVLSSAESYADVSSLDFPDNPAGTPPVDEGRFLIALRNALRFLDSKGQPIKVRMMFGWLADDTSWDDMLSRRTNKLLNGINRRSTSLQIWIGGMSYQGVSWNHSKIVAVDGEELVTGGINFYTNDYLKASPVRDISLRLRGQPARDAHRYLDGIWDTFGYYQTHYTTSGVFVEMAGVNMSSTPPDASDAATEPDSGDTSGIPVITMGRHGLIDRMGINDPAPSDDGMLAAIDAAEESLWFALQDIGPVQVSALTATGSYAWPEELITILTQKAIDEVEVSIVLSSPYQEDPAAPDDFSYFYSYGWSLPDVLFHWKRTVSANPTLKAAAEATVEGSVEALICNRISLASVRINSGVTGDDVWSDGSPMGNHSKLWIADGKAFYVGSQNLYISNLFEWGLLVDDETQTQEVIDDYWGPMWEHSKRTAVSGPEATSCPLLATSSG